MNDGSLIAILIGSALIIIIGVVFRKQLAKVPLKYGLIVLASVLAVVGAEQAARKIDDTKRKYL